MRRLRGRWLESIATPDFPVTAGAYTTSGTETRPYLISDCPEGTVDCCQLQGRPIHSAPRTKLGLVTTVCICAYDTVTRLSALGLLNELRSVIVAAAARGAMATIPALRYRVARLVAQLHIALRSNVQDPELAEIVQTLRADQHYSVRSAIDACLVQRFISTLTYKMA